MKAVPVSGMSGQAGPSWVQPPFWHLMDDDADLLALLVGAGCPAPCVGVRQPDGEDWHALCEERGRQAFAVLRGWTTVKQG